MLLTPYFEQPDVLSVGTLPQRAYTIPYASWTEARVAQRRQDSSYYHDLNGTWQFKYFPNVRTIEVPYWEDNTSLDWTTIPVPSCWQMQGYDQIQYSNTEFPIPFDPPYVPYENPAGLYQRYIELAASELAADYELVFEGVDSAFYVWVNGHFVGYDQISHASSIFTIGPWLTAGRNRLTVLVVKWSDGTYLEDQDKFRNSGIFRDVYLLKRDAKRMMDYRVITQVEPDGQSAHLHLELVSSMDERAFKYQLYHPEGQLVSEGEFDGAFHLTLNQPALWSAEQPWLYTLIWQVGAEVYRQRIGVRQIEIKEQQLYLNHQSIKLFGVNHHDSWPDTGATVPLARQRQDLELMKSYNFNAVRTAHYQKSPEFYELCDELGMYVVSETDLECHGVVDLYGRGGNDNYNQLAYDEQFRAACVARMVANVRALKNFSSIIMWSAGNESGYGPNIEAMLAQARSDDPTRPLHYEAYWYHRPDTTYDTQYLDVWSRMYPAVEEIEALYFDSDGAYAPLDRPFMLCEYAHAMGNGPGDLQDYYDCMMRHAEFIGAFVWEWADHAIKLPEATNVGTWNQGLPVYRYGGDHGEYPHAGNFCMDGLMYPDRRPHIGAFEYRQIHRPVRLEEVDLVGRTLQFGHRYQFSSLASQVTLEIVPYNQSGDALTAWQVSDWQAEPGQLAIVTLPESWDLDELSSFRCLYYQADDGLVLGEDQIRVQELTWPGAPRARAPEQPWLSEDVQSYTLHWRDQVMRIDKGTAMLSSYRRRSREILGTPGRWQIWRAPTDNDREIAKEWRQANYHHCQVRVHQIWAQTLGNEVQLHFEAVIAGLGRQAAVQYQGQWVLNHSGELRLTVTAQRPPEMVELPRFGMVLPLVRVDQVAYIGYGPYENYCDKYHSCYWGFFVQPPQAFYEPYVTPQEHGARQATALQIQGEREILAIAAAEGLSFNLSPYSVAQLTRVGHRDELKEEPYLYLHLDYQHAGIGSQSCGPRLAPQYRLDESEFSFSWVLAVHPTE